MKSRLLQILILLLSCVRLCSKTTQPDITYTHNGRTCVKCPPGTYLISHCDKENEVGQCRLCPNGTYSSQYDIATSCAPCKEFCENKDLVEVKKCTKLTNMECACPNGTFNVNADLPLSHAKCIPHGVCGPGYGVKVQATSVKNTICERCGIGKTYSLTTSASDRCQLCTNCGQFDVIAECNTTHNRICDIEPKNIPYQRCDTDEYTLTDVMTGGIIGAAIGAIIVIGIMLLLFYEKLPCF
ncbi:tumor necrosis factor receptor superfamily member 11B-like [Pecten maximus]|uniref:tumor necrosis factor receptor superfamily member 11B-like n=1 Tax=Pecten maximus TaxID=6579 RepID=UPI001457F7CE|nr:tumor necrosis factor receptor superfamily member 11B-like [Pecten maximus]